MPHEQLTTQLQPHAAGELTMTQVQTIKTIKTAEAGFPLDHFHVIPAHFVSQDFAPPGSAAFSSTRSGQWH
jgi:aromatic ring-opening dioxygenase LigB subunit